MMQRLKVCAWRVACVGVLVGVWAGGVEAAPVVFSAAGADAASIQTTVDSFRAVLGNLNANTGTFPDGRKEINWDGVGAGATDPTPFPGDFFNGIAPGRARGLQLTTPGTGFLVSANDVDVAPIEFGFANDFSTFSAQKLFTAVNSNITDVTFFVAGTTTPAFVSGFGSVFTDVEVAGATRIDFYDTSGVLLYGGSVQTSGNAGLSFLGVYFNAGERVGLVRLTSGANTIVSNGVLGNQNDDVVVMDDFIYAEPQSVPEPATVLLLAAGVAGTVARRRTRR